MKLVVFDLDGTLARTDRVDGECFTVAVNETLEVGDTVRDVRTAKNLRLPFIGVARGSKADVLRDNGAHHVIEDYHDIERCLRYLEEAKTP